MYCLFTSGLLTGLEVGNDCGRLSTTLGLQEGLEALVLADGAAGVGAVLEEQPDE